MGLYGMILCIPNGILAERELLSHDGSFFFGKRSRGYKAGSMFEAGRRWTKSRQYVSVCEHNVEF